MRIASLITAWLATMALVVYSQSPANKPESIGAGFHRETSFGDRGFVGEPRFGESVPLFKEYGMAKRVKLRDPALGGLAVEDAIHQRLSVRSFADRPISLPQLARLLLSAAGLTQARDGFVHRAAPSAGALYPIEIYIAASKVDSLPDGLYHFGVKDTSLALVRSGNIDSKIHSAANDQDMAGSSPLTLFITARFDRVTRKYADRGYRYAYMESGAVCQNIYLQAASLGLGTVVLGSFSDETTNRLLEIDGVHEAALLIMPVGYEAP